MSTKHTPGTFTTKPAANECVAIYNFAGFHIATVNQECAPLFIAAPALLAALQGVVEGYDSAACTLESRIAAARAAIAEATATK